MLDYKDIIIKHHALHMSGREIASALGVSKSGVNEFLNAFDKCDTLHYPLPEASPTMGLLSWRMDPLREAGDGTLVMNYRISRRSSPN